MLNLPFFLFIFPFRFHANNKIWRIFDFTLWYLSNKLLHFIHVCLEQFRRHFLHISLSPFSLAKVEWHNFWCVHSNLYIHGWMKVLRSILRFLNLSKRKFFLLFLFSYVMYVDCVCIWIGPFNCMFLCMSGQFCIENFRKFLKSCNKLTGIQCPGGCALYTFICTFVHLAMPFYFVDEPHECTFFPCFDSNCQNSCACVILLHRSPALFFLTFIPNKYKLLAMK